ncbi:MAG: glycosyltransferase [bacterium]
MLNKQNNKPKIAIISSPNAGLGHYAAHLFGPLSKYCDPKFITFPQTDLLGTTTPYFTDSFMKRYIKWPRFTLNDGEPQSVVEVANYLESRDIHLVNIHIGTTIKQKIGYYMSLVQYCKTVYKVKFVFTLHDVLPWVNDKKFVQLLDVFYKQADYLILGNDREYAKLVDNFTYNLEKTSIIRHGIYNLFDSNLYDKRIARYLLNLPQDKTILLFFGFLKEFKGFEYLIDAAKILKKEGENIVVYVASALKYAPKELVNKVLSKIHQLELNDDFILNLNYLDTHDIEAVFKASDVSILPYTNASQSGVLMLSIGFKKPVVISDVFAEKEWIDKKAGLVAKNRDPKDLAKKIKTLIADKKTMEEYGQYGYEYGMKHLNWEDIAKKYYGIFKKVL